MRLARNRVEEMKKEERRKKIVAELLKTQEVIKNVLVPFSVSSPLPGLLKLDLAVLPERTQAIVNEAIENSWLWLQVRYYKNGKEVETRGGTLAHTIAFGMGPGSYDKVIYQIIDAKSPELVSSFISEKTADGGMHVADGDRLRRRYEGTEKSPELLSTSAPEKTNNNVSGADMVERQDALKRMISKVREEVEALLQRNSNVHEVKNVSEKSPMYLYEAILDMGRKHKLQIELSIYDGKHIKKSPEVKVHIDGVSVCEYMELDKFLVFLEKWLNGDISKKNRIKKSRKKQ